MKKYKPRVSHFGYEQAKQQSKSDIIKLGKTMERRAQEHKMRKHHREEQEKIENELEAKRLENGYEEESEIDEAKIEEDLKVGKLLSKKIKDKYKSSTLFVSSGPSGKPNELMEDMNPDGEIKNLVME